MVLQNQYDDLKMRIEATPYSRDVYRQAIVIYTTPHLFDPVTRAWAFWVATIQGFSNMVGSWRASQPRCKESLLNANKKAMLTPEYCKRLRLTQIENTDAVSLIGRMDKVETFFYVDPPYVGSDQGHYGGYTQEYFNALIDRLESIKGKFLLSSYPNTYLSKVAKKQGWWQQNVDMCNSASGNKRRKIEVLTGNYELKKNLVDLP